MSDKELIKVLIDEVEWYPVYTMEKMEHAHCGYAAEIPEKLYKKWEKTMADFDKLQEELSKLYYKYM